LNNSSKGLWGSVLEIRTPAVSCDIEILKGAPPAVVIPDIVVALATFELLVSYEMAGGLLPFMRIAH